MLSFLWMLETVLMRFWNLEPLVIAIPTTALRGFYVLGGVAELDVCSLHMCAIYDVLMDHFTQILFLRCDELLTMSDWYFVFLQFFNMPTRATKGGGVGTLTRILDFVQIEIIWDHGYYIMMTHGAVKCKLLWSDQGRFLISRQVAASISPSSMRKPRNFTLCQHWPAELNLQ